MMRSLCDDSILDYTIYYIDVVAVILNARCVFATFALHSKKAKVALSNF